MQRQRDATHTAHANLEFSYNNQIYAKTSQVSMLRGGIDRLLRRVAQLKEEEDSEENQERIKKLKAAIIKKEDKLLEVEDEPWPQPPPPPLAVDPQPEERLSLSAAYTPESTARPRQSPELEPPTVGGGVSGVTGAGTTSV